ncbi:MAG: Na+/H+ antiporter subunit E [Gammaproteobacteria bacterium]|nr:Na+/H+ antiporter subunit E [Gammaproteobacteria bacterium]
MSKPDLHTPQISRLASILILFVLLAATWLVWSGLFKALLLFLGLVSSVLCLWLAIRMRFFDDYLFSLPVGRGYLRYLVWLTREVIKSSLDVTKVVLSPSLPISPRIARIRAGSDHPYDQVLFANSITLTPGTLSMDLDEGVITVHALTEQGMRDLLAGEMDRRITALRGK